MPMYETVLEWAKRGKKCILDQGEGCTPGGVQKYRIYINLIHYFSTRLRLSLQMYKASCLGKHLIPNFKQLQYKLFFKQLHYKLWSNCS